MGWVVFILSGADETFLLCIRRGHLNRIHWSRDQKKVEGEGSHVNTYEEARNAKAWSGSNILGMLRTKKATMVREK